MRRLPTARIADFDVRSLPRGDKATGRLEVAGRPDGGNWELPLLYVTGVDTGPTLLVLGGVHGNEYEGVEAIPRIFAATEPESLRGNLIMLAVCNMPAYEAGTRNSPIDGQNLARVFPGDPKGTISLRIAHWIDQRFIAPADLLIDLHSGGPETDIPTMIGYQHSDDDLGRAAEAAARAFGAPVLWGHPPDPTIHGRTCNSAGDYGVPWLYTETSGGGRADADALACYTDGVFNVMRHLGMLDGQPQPRSMTHHLLGNGNLDEILSVSTAGFFRAEVALLDQVEEGQTIGTVHDLFGLAVETVTADRSGVVILLRRSPTVSTGTNVANITDKLPR